MRLTGDAIMQSDLLDPRTIPVDDLCNVAERRLLAGALAEGQANEATEEALGQLIAWAERVFSDRVLLDAILDGSLVVTAVPPMPSGRPGVKGSARLADAVRKHRENHPLTADERDGVPF